MSMYFSFESLVSRTMPRLGFIPCSIVDLYDGRWFNEYICIRQVINMREVLDGRIA